MHLDGLTLMAAGSFVTAVTGLLLIGAWAQIRARALLWWAAAGLINAAAIGSLAVGIGSNIVPAIIVGVGLSSLAPVLIWAGARTFSDRKVWIPGLLAGPIVWMVAGALPLSAEPGVVSEAVSFTLWVVYLGATIAELWRSREELLTARIPLIGFIALHALVFAVGIFDALAGGVPAGFVPPLSSWFSLIHFETLIYALGATTFMILICNERIERRQLIASRNDSLTGITNRGAFLNNAERTLRRCQADAISFSLIMFDLDRFKRINDNYGHDVGDAVLRKFADTTRSVLRPNDLFGRYGGEEFVVVLPGATVEAAYVIAERIRHRFAEAGAFTAGQQTNATVSAGVASASSVSTLDTIMRAADQAMYRAKGDGRNRVERSAPAVDRDEPEAIVRIA